MQVAYDSQVSWPMTWYLRDFSGFLAINPNRGHAGKRPGDCGRAKNWQKVSPTWAGLSRYEVIRMWWPMEDYRELELGPHRGALGDPQMRLALWEIILVA
jgi:hypothetical protein